MLQFDQKTRDFCMSLIPDFSMPDIELTILPSGILGYALTDQNKILICEKGLKKDPIEAKDTILHELAHFLTFSIFGDRVLDHGSQWRSICQKIGAKPDQRQDANTPIKTYYIYDNGQKSENVSKRMHSMIQAGKSKRFAACNWIKELT